VIANLLVSAEDSEQATWKNLGPGGVPGCLQDCPNSSFLLMFYSPMRPLRDSRQFFQNRVFPRVSGFSLVELLSVMAVIALLMAMVAPAFNGIRGGANVNRATFELAGVLEQARSYALAQNTYVWVGFFEEDVLQGPQNPAQPGQGGRVVVSVVASRDGGRYSDAVVNGNLPEPFGSAGPSNPVELVQINRLVRLENVRMVSANSANQEPPRPDVPDAYQIGDSRDAAPDNSGGAFARRAGAVNSTTFTYPLAVASPQYRFAKIIEFNPQGEASKIAEHVFSGPGPQNAIEIALVPVQGSTIDPRYAGQNKVASVIQVEGLTGRVRLFRL
jgi:prepilin-type N-terminal cleavage/methylation domain-containing protein